MIRPALFLFQSARIISAPIAYPLVLVSLVD
jgi:hypothetical protein